MLVGEQVYSHLWGVYITFVAELLRFTTHKSSVKELPLYSM